MLQIFTVFLILCYNFCMNNMNFIFLDRMKDLLKDEYDDFVLSLEQAIQKAVYANSYKISAEKFLSLIDFEVEQIPYETNGFYVDNEKRGRHPLHHAGAMYLQEPSAMFTVNAIDFNGDEKVLDMCAAPGGKTIQLANRIPNGVLVSNEFNRARSEILFSNVERMGLKNVIVANDSPQNIAKAYGDCFDVCLVDAPCSGEGMFRRGADVLKEWHPGINEMCAKRQLEILYEADKVLKEEGVLIYSTCTYAIEENEQVVNKFLSTRNYELQNIDWNFPRGINMKQAVRLYPHKVKGEGQFVAVMKKISGDANNSSSTMKLSSSKITCDFVNKNISAPVAKSINETVVEYGNYCYYAPHKEMIKKHINYVSLGVRLGQVVGTRFEPHHNLFTAFGKEFNTKLNLSLGDKFVEKYLRGETFDVDLPSGYGAVLLEGISLGGCKISQGKLKNLYPKGLRNF